MICDPQLALVNVTLTWPGPPATCRSLASASWTLIWSAKLSLLVWTCHLAFWPTPSCCTTGSSPPPASLTTEAIWVVETPGALNWKRLPPLNSTL